MRKKGYRAAAVCLGIAVCHSTAVYGAWETDGSRWQYTAEDGHRVRSDWLKDQGDWYRFGQEGFMETGWYLAPDGTWYFLNPVSDGTRGRMMTGWQWVDGYCYYLSEQSAKDRPLGAMYAAGKTPDGYVVDESGAWVDEQGIPVYVPGKGIRTKAAPGVSLRAEGSGGSAGSGSSGSSAGSAGSGSPWSSGGSTGNGSPWSSGENTGSGSSGSGGGNTGSESSGSGSPWGDGGNTGSGSSGSGEGSAGNVNPGSGGGSTGSGSPENGGEQPENESPESGSENPGGGGGLDNSGSLAERDPAGEGIGQSQINWQVHFTDLSTHQMVLMPSRSGNAEDGSDLTIYFPTRFADGQGRIWQSVQQSPFVVNVTGPQNRIFYVEYEQTGETGREEDPWQGERQRLQEFIETARQAEADFLGLESAEEVREQAFLAEDKYLCDLRLKSAASRLEPGQEGIFYVIGKNYVPEGSVLAENDGDELEYSNTTEGEVVLEGDVYTLARFHVCRKEADRDHDTVWDGETRRHWNVGDVQERILDDISYRFRCIDQNYGDEADRGRQKALFLCESVIPADKGSEYVYERLEDGTYDSVFRPGPIVSFGDTDSYKYSRIRSWLAEVGEGMEGLLQVSTGSAYEYEGSTVPDSREQMDRGTLKARYIGSQAQKDRLFILSVDEALRYGRWLWRFEGAEEENPESQWGAFCESYWLRTPGRSEGGQDMVYVVDLVRGNIHPQPVACREDEEDPELGSTGSTGVRPAFVVQQY